MLTRERLGRRPLEIEGQVDPLWSKPAKDSSKVCLLDIAIILHDRLYNACIYVNAYFQQLWSRTDEIGQRVRVDGRGDMVYSDLTSLDLIAKKVVDEEEDAEESLYRRVFPGDIAVEAPLFILLPPEGETLELSAQRVGSVSISAPNPLPALNERDWVSVSFQVVGDYLLEEGRLRSQPPRLIDFFVDHIRSTTHDNS